MSIKAAKKIYERLDLPSGILDRRPLPDEQFDRTWDSIFLSADEKEQLLNQAIVTLTLRSKDVGREVIPTHGVILLEGPPGTGKTSLARGMSSQVARYLKGAAITFLEVEPHSLTSSAMGKTQRAVTELFGSTIPEQAATGPVIVLLDEVETLATDRQKLSLEANPVDVHRATDAVLAQIDHLADRYPNILFIATSNYATAIDDAFVSRCDLVINIPLPNAEARRAILEDTILGLARTFPGVKKLLESPEFTAAVEVTEGVDGRALRKMIPQACARTRASSVDPGKITGEALLEAAETLRKMIAQKEGV